MQPHEKLNKLRIHMGLHPISSSFLNLCPGFLINRKDVHKLPDFQLLHPSFTAQEACGPGLSIMGTREFRIKD